MKQKYIALLAFFGLLFLPVAALAQTDLSVTEADVSIGDSLEPVETGKEVRIFATINNLGDEDAIADAQFYAGNTLLGTRNVTILAGESAAAFWDWTPDTAQTLEVSVSLSNISVEDTDESNNSVVISTVEVVEGDGEILEEVSSEDMTSDQEVSEDDTDEEVVDEEQLEVEESSTSEHEVMVQAQRLAWDSFRFMPAGVLDASGKEFLWNFGDNSTSSEQVAEHSYGKPGTYQVSLQILGGEMPQNASMQVRVGFFHLANWRLWIVIVVLALIIVVGAIVAGMSGSIADSKPGMQPKVPDPNIAQSNSTQEPEEDFLADSSSITEDGMEDELSLLDDLDEPAAEETSKPMTAVSAESADMKDQNSVLEINESAEADTSSEEEGIEPLAEETAKPKAKKKATKSKTKTKKATKKKTISKSTKAKTKTTKKKKALKKK